MKIIFRSLGMVINGTQYSYESSVSLTLMWQSSTSSQELTVQVKRDLVDEQIAAKFACFEAKR